MKEYLFNENGTFYKANLHAHSTVSDGACTPAELKEIYKAAGYSILAVTDHELLVDHSDLDDADFLTITGYEYAIIEKDMKDYVTSRTVEFNLFAKDQHNVTQVLFDPSTVYHGETFRVPQVKYHGELCKKEFTKEFLQRVIDEANAHGFLVSLNHPHYSMITPELFGDFQGLFAMEIYNHISYIVGGHYEYDPQMYDVMLRRGHSLYCIAADDCHGKRPADDPQCENFGGFVMIRAEELSYPAVIRALSEGQFYASQGPLIHELYIEDGNVHIKVSGARHIAMCCDARRGSMRVSPRGSLMTEAVFPLPVGAGYMRFDVMDGEGRHAMTHAYPV